jgi:hypothetical protein
MIQKPFLNHLGIGIFYGSSNLAKGTAIVANRFEPIALTQLLLGGCVVLVAASLLVRPAHTQPGVSYPNPPTQSVSVPSSAYTVPQQASTPLPYAPPSSAPAHMLTSPMSVPRTAAAAYGGGYVVETRPNRHRMLESYSAACGYLGCVRTYSWAFPCQYYSRYCY